MLGIDSRPRLREGRLFARMKEVGCPNLLDFAGPKRGRTVIKLLLPS